MWPLFQFRRTWLFVVVVGWLVIAQLLCRIGERRKWKREKNNAIVLRLANDLRIEMICVRASYGRQLPTSLLGKIRHRCRGNGQIHANEWPQKVLECFFLRLLIGDSCVLERTVSVWIRAQTTHLISHVSYMCISMRKSFPDIITFTSLTYLCVRMCVRSCVRSAIRVEHDKQFVCRLFLRLSADILLWPIVRENVFTSENANAIRMPSCMNFYELISNNSDGRTNWIGSQIFAWTIVAFARSLFFRFVKVFPDKYHSIDVSMKIYEEYLLLNGWQCIIDLFITQLIKNSDSRIR